ncbi:MAG: hypothetical protein IJC71_06785 [Clostridia bacterium]|nr:hypothetical protein [Clostridia bacterium]
MHPTENITGELLAQMHRNVSMGSENLATVVPKIHSKFLLSNVTYQLEKYADFTNRTENLLKQYEVTPKPPALMKKLMSRGGIALNTLFDSSDRHIAEMIVRGTKTGAEQLEHKLHELHSRTGDANAVGLCREILDFEYREADRMLDFC